MFQDLPLLGPLFGLRDDQQVFDHVLVFVIPTLLDDVAPLSLPGLPELTTERASELLEPWGFWSVLRNSEIAADVLTGV